MGWPLSLKRMIVVKRRFAQTASAIGCVMGMIFTVLGSKVAVWLALRSLLSGGELFYWAPITTMLSAVTAISFCLLFVRVSEESSTRVKRILVVLCCAMVLVGLCVSLSLKQASNQYPDGYICLVCDNLANY